MLRSTRLFSATLFVLLVLAVFPGAAVADCGPIVIDPGHGGWDSGAVGPQGYEEKVANLDIALRVRKLLIRYGYPVVLTRASDRSPNTPPTDLTGDGKINISDDLQARVNTANRAKGRVFVSIHNNASISSSARGTETYYWSGVGSGSDSAKLARYIQQEVVSQIGLYDRGVKTANFYVLKRTKMPAVLLEGAFISNAEEERLLRTATFRQKIALGIFRGIRRYVGQAKTSGPGKLNFKLAPGARRSINLNSYFCDRSLGQTVAANVPVVAERAVYFNSGGRSGGTATRGAPKPGRNWYFAEGYTGTGFDTWLLLANPGSEARTAAVTYLTESGVATGPKVVIPAGARRTIHVNKELPGREFGIRVAATGPIVAERAVYFNYDGRDGGHVSVGAQVPTENWYFAEGYTGPGFDTWLLLLNPSDRPARVRLAYPTNSGRKDGGVIVVPPHRRRSVSVNLAVPNQETAAIVKSDTPIVAERSVYFRYDGLVGGHNSLGARAPAGKWHFAEGTTYPGFTEFLTLQNPNSRPAGAVIEYRFDTGERLARNHVIAPGSRLTVPVADQGQAGQNKNVAVTVTADSPIVAERPVYFSYGDFKGGHDSIGSTSLSRKWYFAEGFTGTGFETWLLVANPGSSEATVTVGFMKD